MRFNIAAAATFFAAAASAATSPVQARDGDLSQAPASSLVSGLVSKLPVDIQVNSMDQSSGNAEVGIVAELGSLPLLGSLPVLSRTVTVNITVSGLSGLLP